jgi:hypothetical protein
MAKISTEVIEAIADAWASVDGRGDDFRAGKDPDAIDDPGGYYSGYMADAAELAKRLSMHGFTVVRGRSH